MRGGWGVGGGGVADMFKVPLGLSLPLPRSLSLSLEGCDFHQECFIWTLYYTCCPGLLKGSFNIRNLRSVACEAAARS